MRIATMATARSTHSEIVIRFTKNRRSKTTERITSPESTMSPRTQPVNRYHLKSRDRKFLFTELECRATQRGVKIAVLWVQGSVGRKEEGESG